MRGTAMILIAACVSGCAAFATRDDYLDYRAVRLERRPDAQLLAMQHYVSKHPSGRWHDQVQAERLRRERGLFEAGKSDRNGLEFYLAAFPHGVFADQARARLTTIALIEQRKRDDASRAASLEEQRRQRDAELGRTWLTRFIGYWTKTLTTIEGWGTPIPQVAQANPEFSRAFGRPPRPRCTGDECVKYYESSYAVPVPGSTRIERNVRLVLRLQLSESHLTRAELLLPQQGFSRWLEIEERQPVVEGDVEARKHAVEFALAKLLSLLDQVAPQRKALAGYVLRPLTPLQVTPSGELVDTSVADPSAPSNRIAGSAPKVAVPANAEPLNKDWAAPTPAEQTPDMIMNPLRVGPDGRALPDAPAPAARAAAAGNEPGEAMEMAPVVVPRAGGRAPQSGVQAQPGQPGPAQAQVVEIDRGVTQAFEVRGLRIVVFAAPSNAPDPAYDGLIVERITPPPHAARPAASGPGGSTAVPPPAAPRPPAAPLAPAAPP